MSSPVLLSFDEIESLSSQNAWHDKIEIEVGDWSSDLTGLSEARQVISNMGASPLDRLRSKIHEPLGSIYGWIFNRIHESAFPSDDDDNAAFTFISEIRTGPLKTISDDRRMTVILPPLFSGKARWGARMLSRRYHTTCALTLYINPTRYARYQSHGATGRAGISKPLNPRPAPFGEISNDFKDNWLPQSGRLFSNLKKGQRRVDVRLITREYFQKIERAFSRELNRSLGVPAWRRLPRYKLKYVETYWDILCEDPWEVFDRLAPFAFEFLKSVGGDRSTKRVHTEANMPSVKGKTKQGEQLKIYVKTNNRIRIEVIHSLTGSRDKRYPFERELNANGEWTRQGSIECPTVDELFRTLERLKRRAACVAHEFLARARRRGPIVSSSITGYRALLDLSYALPSDYRKATAIASMLIHNGRIELTSDAPSDFRAAILTLIKNGFLMRSGTRSVYIASEKYRHAFQMLSEHGRFDNLIRRPRERSSFLHSIP